MKLRLPQALFRAVIACLSACVSWSLMSASLSEAAYMHSSPLLEEYTDLAENRGVYRFGYSPSVITYRNGEADYVLTVTPDYSSVADMGCFTLTHNGSFQMTVEHNGIMDNNGFNGRYVGDYAQKYCGVGINDNKTFESGWNNTQVPMHEDYKVERISRLVTDADSVNYCTNEELLANINGVTVYRVGSGNSGWYDTEGNATTLAGAWGSGMTAGITEQLSSYRDSNGVFHTSYSITQFDTLPAGDPLPSAGRPGDSGSPIFIYNAETGRMELIGSLQGYAEGHWIARYNPTATTAIMEHCTVNVTTAADYNGADSSIYYISGAHIGTNDELLQDGNAATYLRKGSISLNGQELASYNGR